MAARSRPLFLDIEYSRRIDRDMDQEFLYILQSALLLSLKEAELLNFVEYRQAKEKLDVQFGKRVGS